MLSRFNFRELLSLYDMILVVIYPMHDQTYLRESNFPCLVEVSLKFAPKHISFSLRTEELIHFLVKVSEVEEEEVV